MIVRTLVDIRRAVLVTALIGVLAAVLAGVHLVDLVGGIHRLVARSRSQPS